MRILEIALSLFPPGKMRLLKQKKLVNANLCFVFYGTLLLNEICEIIDDKNIEIFCHICIKRILLV